MAFALQLTTKYRIMRPSKLVYEETMGLSQVGPGKDVPNDINVIIEIPANSAPIKYEVDKETEAMFVDRFLTTCMRYPCDYGYVPKTLSQDGDPVDVLVVSPMPISMGSVIRVRPIGMLNMTDEAGPDQKIIAVPIDKLTLLYRDIQKIDDLPDPLLSQIMHFFNHYKDLDVGKWVKVEGWEGPEAAKQEILNSIERYKAEHA